MTPLLLASSRCLRAAARSAAPLFAASLLSLAASACATRDHRPGHAIGSGWSREPPPTKDDAPTTSEESAAPEAAARAPELPVEPAEPSPPKLDLPARAADAETGSAFLRRTDELGRSALDDQIEAAILSGNVPNYLRQLVPITIQADGREALLFVSNDYLAIGSDDDFVRIPMTSAAAQRIANRLGATLPTPKLVDEIYRQAEVKLPPSWIDGGPTPGSLKDYALHNKTLEERRVKGGYPLGPLTAGHKKDIVLCQVIAEKPTRVAIYGWHKREGEVIQPVSTSHSCRYADYSHGVRLIDQMMWIDGKAHRVSDVLRDPERASIISNEGAIPIVEYDTVLVPYR